MIIGIIVLMIGGQCLPLTKCECPEQLFLRTSDYWETKVTPTHGYFSSHEFAWKDCIGDNFFVVW